MKILIINPFGVGDVLFTTPLISNLRKAYPEAFIAYVVNRRALSIIESNPKVNKVYVYERDEFKNDLAKKWTDFYFELRNQKFDLAIDFTLNSPFGFLSLACGIKQRIGYDYKGRGCFLTNKIPLQSYESRHIVDHYLDLLDILQVPIQTRFLELFINQEHQKWADDWIKAKTINPKTKIIGMVPGGGASWGSDASKKRWPIDGYARLLDKIIAKSKTPIILMGDQKEQQLSCELARQCSYPVYDAVGSTSLLQMAALFQRCHLVICNDGGPLHMAVAVGVKTVSIFGPVDPVVYGPYPFEGHIIIQKGLACQPCYRQFRRAACEHIECLNRLSVDEVFNHIERLL